MAKKEVIDISDLVVTPLLNGTNNKQDIWTGMVRLEDIDSFLISDENLRKQFIKLVKEYEMEIIKYRTLSNSTNSLLEVKTKSFSAVERQKNECTDKIGTLSDEIRRLMQIGIRQETFDDRVFYIRLFRRYEEIVKNNPEEIKHMSPNMRKLLENYRKGILSESPIITTAYSEEENKYGVHAIFADCQKRKCNYSPENKEKLAEILSQINGESNITIERAEEILKEICASITISDIPHLFPNPQYARLQYNIFLRNYLLQKGYSIEQLKTIDPKNIEATVLSVYNQESLDTHTDLITEAVKGGIDFMDLERFLLISSVRTLQSFDLISRSKDIDEYEDEEIVVDTSDLPENDDSESSITTTNIVQEVAFRTIAERMKRREKIINAILKNNMISKKTKLELIMAGGYKEVSVKSIEEKMKNFCDGYYITNVVEANLIIEALQNEEGISNWSDELVRRVEFDFTEMGILALSNFENLKRLHSLGKFDKTCIADLLVEIKDETQLAQKLDNACFEGIQDRIPEMVERSKKLFKYLCDEELLDITDMRNLFAQGIIEEKDFDSLLDEADEEKKQKSAIKIKEVLAPEVILEKYKNYAEQSVVLDNITEEMSQEELDAQRDKTSKARKEKDRYLHLFKKYNGELTEEQRIEMGDQLLEKYYIEMGVEDNQLLSESIRIMYEDGLIDFENIINLDREYIIPMLDSLSLADASKIRNSMSFEDVLDMLDTIFSSEEFSNERKFIIMMNLLNEETEEDKEAMDLYRGLLDFDENEKRAKGKGKKGKGKDKDDDDFVETPESKMYRYPDTVKWRFYKALDKDMRVTRYSNGYVEFASRKLGKRIIEKYYDRAGEQAYGTATYVLSDDNFREHQDELITLSGKERILETTTLRKITPRTDRIPHRTKSKDKSWMQEVAKYFGIDLQKDSRYTQEEIDNLRATIEQYKDRYEIIK